MADEEGASPSEQFIEAARRNNIDLLREVIADIKAKQPDNETAVAELLNSAQDPLGNTPLYLAAANGSDEVLDTLLDQDGLEVDPVNRQQGDTPLHAAVRYARSEPEHGAYIVELLIDVGADPRIKNKAGQKPIDLVDDNQIELFDSLRGAELARNVGPMANTEMEDGAAEDDGNGSDSD
jgi:ankyrin repeat protein